MVDLELLEDIFEQHLYEIIGLCVLLVTVLYLRLGPLPVARLKTRKMPAASPQTVCA